MSFGSVENRSNSSMCEPRSSFGRSTSSSPITCRSTRSIPAGSRPNAAAGGCSFVRHLPQRQSSGESVRKLLAGGFSKPVNVEGGTLACVQAGLPVIHGKKAMSLERQVRLVAGGIGVRRFSVGFVQSLVLGGSGVRGRRPDVRSPHRLVPHGHAAGENALESGGEPPDYMFVRIVPDVAGPAVPGADAFPKGFHRSAHRA